MKVWFDFPDGTCIEQDIFWEPLERIYDHIDHVVEGIYIVIDKVSGEVCETLIGAIDEEEKELLLGMV